MNFSEATKFVTPGKATSPRFWRSDTTTFPYPRRMGRIWATMSPEERDLMSALFPPFLSHAYFSSAACTTSRPNVSFDMTCSFSLQHVLSNSLPYNYSAGGRTVSVNHSRDPSTLFKVKSLCCD